MEWLVLKNRRHEGPFTESALREALRKGRIGPDDYVIALKEAEEGDLNYQPLKKVLNLSETFASGNARKRLPESDESPPAAPQAPEQIKPKRPAADPRFLNALDSSDFVPLQSRREKSSAFAANRELRPEALKPAPEPEKIESAPAELPHRRQRGPWRALMVSGALMAMALVALLFKQSSVNVAKTKKHAAKEENLISASKPRERAAPQSATPLADSGNRQPSALRMPVVAEAPRNIPPVPDSYIPPPPVPEPYVPPQPPVEAPQQVPTQFTQQQVPQNPNPQQGGDGLMYNSNGEPYYDYNNPNRAVGVDPNYAGDGYGAPPPQGAFPQVPTQDTLAQ